MRRIKVVTMIDSLSPENLGGGERLAAAIAMGLDRNRFESTLVSSRPSTGGLVREVRESGVRVLELQRTGPRSFRPWWDLGRRLRSERIDVLHAHKFGSNVWGSVVGSAARVPVVLAHEHTWSYEGQPVRKLLDRFVVGGLADRFLAVSQEDRRRMIEIEKVPARKAHYLPIGIPDPPPRTGRDLRTELGIAEDAPVLGTVCALRPQKRLDVLVRAAAELVRDVPNLVVLIAGSGPEEEGLRALAAELGIEEHIRLLGFWPPEDVPDLLAALDVAVNSSDFEGSPLGVMEFMAAGKPLVATAVGGTPDLLDNGVEGLLVPPRDPGALAEAALRLIRDPDLRAQLGERGRERQHADFRLSVLVERLQTLYEELLQRKGVL